jgi:hypothetical protein
MSSDAIFDPGFHIGFVVADLETAMSEFTTTLGI